MKINLNNEWKMRKCGDAVSYICDVPCSVYKVLTDSGVMPDPYYRENQWEATLAADDDYEFEKHFDCTEGFISLEKQLLVFEGIDTLSEIFLNNVKLGETDNMHRRWEFDVKKILSEKGNILKVRILSPTKYIAKKQSERPLWGVSSTMSGYTHLRKAHCMFGWDWGPKLPDMGIWRGVSLAGYSEGRILDVRYYQEHSDGKVYLKCIINCDNVSCDKAALEVRSPDGKTVFTGSTEISGDGKNTDISCVIENPQYWWANGYGAQPLYGCTVKLLKNGVAVDEKSDRIGLRTLTISRDNDEWGEEFCFILNGKKIFAMGANYIPEDQIVTRCNESRTRKLLEQCKKANFNFIRVWGGGYYPDDWFYDYCDENGIIVWQDFMFACSAYLLTEEFEKTVRAEVKDNIIRLRNHCSLGLWCGNNEIESAWEYWGLPDDPQSKSDYLVQFEEIIPALVKEYSPQIFYWPSSPSSGGGFKDASSNHAGDMHYWDVWHNLKPIEAFRAFHYRFCSEYGFESLPSMKTCRAFADETKGDMNLTSPVMEAHQKCEQGNEKIMFYLAQMVRYPYSFEELIYSSQLVQADSIRSNVEHMRRSRGRCMGSAYWQVNDSTPVISWSSIDYFNRWKPLHYCAAKFYAPVLLSVDDSDPCHPVFNVSNETLSEIECTVKWSLRTNSCEIVQSGEETHMVSELSAKDIFTLDLSRYISEEAEKRSKYLEYRLEIGGETVSAGTTLFVRPKMFDFLKPKLKTRIEETDKEFLVCLSAANYTKSVWLELSEEDCVFSDNWFDVHGGETVCVSVKKSEISKYLTLDEFERQLTVKAYNL